MYILSAAFFHDMISASSAAWYFSAIFALSLRFSRAMRFVYALLSTHAVYSSGPVTSQIQKPFPLIYDPRLIHMRAVPHAVAATDDGESRVSPLPGYPAAVRYLPRANMMSASM